MNDAVADYGKARFLAARGGEKTRLNGRALKDLKAWSRIGEEGRVFVEEHPEVAPHTDAAELGGTVCKDESPDAEG